MTDRPVENDSLEPLSPCINICSIDASSGLCRGCYRTLEEIADWGRLAVTEKQAILARLESRRSRWV